jgi:hypothetical protein
MSTEIKGSAAWWLAQDCAAMGYRLIADMDRIQLNGSRTAEEYADAAFAVFVPAVRSRDEEIERLRAQRAVLKAAVADVRRLCDMTIAASCRVQAIHQAEDTLAVLDRALPAPDAPKEPA